MKQFVFKQQVMLGKGNAGHKKVYARGVHAVPEEHQKDPTFLHFAKHGLIGPFVVEEQGELKPAESVAAKQSASVAKMQLEPDAEIGGHDEEPKQRKKGK